MQRINSFTLRNCFVNENTATINGFGGIHLSLTSTASVTIDNCHFNDNAGLLLSSYLSFLSSFLPSFWLYIEDTDHSAGYLD